MCQEPEKKNGLLCWASILRAGYVYHQIIGYYFLKNRKNKRNNFT